MYSRETCVAGADLCIENLGCPQPHRSRSALVNSLNPSLSQRCPDDASIVNPLDPGHRLTPFGRAEQGLAGPAGLAIERDSGTLRCSTGAKARWSSLDGIEFGRSHGLAGPGRHVVFDPSLHIAVRMDWEVAQRQRGGTGIFSILSLRWFGKLS